MKKNLRKIMILTSIFITFSCTTVVKDLEKIKVKTVETKDTESISFSQLLFKIPYNSDFYKNLGIYNLIPKEIKKGYDEPFQRGPRYRYIAEEIMQASGLNVQKRFLREYEDRSDEISRFLLSATINDINYSTYIRRNKSKDQSPLFSTIQLSLTWEVLDTNKNSIVFVSEEKLSVDNDNFYSYNYLFEIAFQKAVLKLCSDKDFLNKIKKREDSRPLPEKIKIKSGSRINILDEESYVNSVVVIRAGKTHGSGVIISNDGYILTAAHVVSNLKEVAVEFKNSEIFLAQVIRTDNYSDSALLKISSEKIDFAGVGIEKKEVSIGQSISIIGTPYRKKYFNTITNGIVSNMNMRNGVKFFHSNTTVNPGNSGGPVLNNAGNIVGITSELIYGIGNSITIFININDILTNLNLEIE